MAVAFTVPSEHRELYIKFAKQNFQVSLPCSLNLPNLSHKIHSVRCSITKQHSKQLTITSQGTAHHSAVSVQGRSQDSTQLPPPERPPGFRLHTASVPLPAHTAAQHCLLLTACCSLPAVHCMLLTAHCSLCAAHCVLLTACCSLHTAHCTLLCSSRMLLAWGGKCSDRTF